MPIFKLFRYKNISPSEQTRSSDTQLRRNLNFILSMRTENLVPFQTESNFKKQFSIVDYQYSYSISTTIVSGFRAPQYLFSDNVAFNFLQLDSLIISKEYLLPISRLYTGRTGSINTKIFSEKLIKLCCIKILSRVHCGICILLHKFSDTLY